MALWVSSELEGAKGGGECKWPLRRAGPLHEAVPRSCAAMAVFNAHQSITAGAGSEIIVESAWFFPLVFPGTVSTAVYKSFLLEPSEQRERSSGPFPRGDYSNDGGETLSQPGCQMLVNVVCLVIP